MTNTNNKETFESLLIRVKAQADYYRDSDILSIYLKLKQLHDQEILEMSNDYNKQQEILTNKISELQTELQELKIRHHCK